MDKRLNNLKHSRERITCASRKLGVFFGFLFLAFLLINIAILSYALFPPPGFSRFADFSFIAIIPFLCENAAIAFVIFLMSKMFLEIGRGDSPFNALRVRQLQVLGVLFLGAVLAGLFIAPGTEMGAYDGSSVMSFYSSQAPPNSVNIDFGNLGAAVICFALSLIFKYGALLQQETDDLM